MPLGIVTSRDLRSPVIAREGNQVAVYGPCNSMKAVSQRFAHLTSDLLKQRYAAATDRNTFQGGLIMVGIVEPRSQSLAAVNDFCPSR